MAKGWVTPKRAEELLPGFFAGRGEKEWVVDLDNRRIASGEREGVNYRSATANDAFFVWFARHRRMLL